ncbi:MAG: Asp-tRNA(Asn)/Glu-tRNA(Gln) amidotransferase GatCAB subunit B [Spirochaetaceae bacterium]|nr:Asp-tRNA(Asn)/Glu-tRNA(Gln) amidotransferase GatCAB subunit B [Spirochaetaceae bacterium]|tara:strand:+ start:21704 stop:23161 length:1458 start_codon:yes stop_codon:yes gene_type:complete
MSHYEPVIGLEVHCQLKTKTKIFSTDPYLYGAAANTQAGPVTLGLPGALPVLNESVMEMALTAALALECEINRHTRFDRKHYFYPDLPKGYQISQYDRPYATGGQVTFRKKDADKDTTIRIHRIHMEEDAGKLLHGQGGGEAVSFVDLNRAGVPLLEIVSEPDLRSSEDAYYYLQTLRSILRAVEVTDGNMEMGSLRCDANVSVRKGPDAPFGTRVEIKNLNSFKAVRAAIDYQIEEQIALIESGQKIVQSTVLWDADKRETRLMRTKENAEDYRYFPDPDLPEFVIEEELIEKVKKEMPELPAEKRARYSSEYGLPEYDADVLTREKETSAYYEEVVKLTDDPKKSSNWVKDEVLGIVNKLDVEIQDFFVTPERLSKIIQYLNDKKFTQRIAKQVFEHCYEEKMEIDDIIEKYDYKPVDTSDLPAIVEKVFADNPEQVNDILNGKDRVKGFLVGQIMKATRGQAPPDEVNKLIDATLEKMKAAK